MLLEVGIFGWDMMMVFIGVGRGWLGFVIVLSGELKDDCGEWREEVNDLGLKVGKRKGGILSFMFGVVFFLVCGGYGLVWELRFGS